MRDWRILFLSRALDGLSDSIEDAVGTYVIPGHIVHIRFHDRIIDYHKGTLNYVTRKLAAFTEYSMDIKDAELSWGSTRSFTDRIRRIWNTYNVVSYFDCIWRLLD
jgi:hypothetical protein